MARTDDDSWDVAEGVGATALGVAYARTLENHHPEPLFEDTFAQRFLDAAAAQGWRPPRGAMADRIVSIAGYAACRTRWFDDFFTTATEHGITQAVILAAGLDARAWRLPWAAGTTVFELDQPQVLSFKVETLRGHEPAARYVGVSIDLRHDWPKTLQENGFHPKEPTAWAAEGLLPYLPATGQDLLFERIHELSAAGSRLGVESFGAGFFDPEYLAERSAQLRKAREQSGEPEGPDVADLWFIEERTDVAEWLTAHGWTTTAIAATDLLRRFGRDASAVVPRTEFIEGVLS